MTDIVDRLTYRAENLWAEVRPHAAVLDLEAAAEILRLRGALEDEVRNACCSPNCLSVDIAAKALGLDISETNRLMNGLESERAEDHSTTA